MLPIQDISERLLLVVMGFHMSQGRVYHRAAVVQQNLHCSSHHCQAGVEGCMRAPRVVHHTCRLAEWNLSSWLWWHSNELEQGLHCLPQTWGNKANIYPQRMNLFGRRLHKQHGLSSPTCEDTHTLLRCVWFLNTIESEHPISSHCATELSHAVLKGFFSSETERERIIELTKDLSA